MKAGRRSIAFMSQEKKKERAEVEQFGGKRRTSKLRLPPHDVGILRLLWGGVASTMGLGSNYAFMIANMVDRESKIVTVQPIDGMQNNQQALSTHEWKGNVMHIKSHPIVRRGFVCRCSGDCSCDVELSAVERWACWSNRVNGADGKEVNIAYHAVEYMIDHGKGDLVGILFRMYGGVTPFWRYGQFQDMEDLVPVAPDTPTITRYLECNREILGLSAWTAMEQLMVRKSGDTKAQDKMRIMMTKKIKTEAEKILIRASSAYMEAKKHV